MAIVITLKDDAAARARELAAAAGLTEDEVVAQLVLAAPAPAVASDPARDALDEFAGPDIPFDRSAGWCCTWFRQVAERPGERGAAIFAAYSPHLEAGRSDGVRFYLQFRATDDVTAEIRCSEPVSLTEDLVIRFCPGCGAELMRFYEHSVAAMRRDDLPAR